MSHKLTLKELPVRGKKVLMRVDFNVPLDKSGNITDDTRIRASLPSIQYVLDQGGALVLMSHLGRPKGGPSPEFSLAPCAKRLSELLGKPVLMAPDCVGDKVSEMAKNLKPGEVLLLENLRFHKGEEKPESDPEFVKSWQV
jgi:phosphoglycerate kinase